METFKMFLTHGVYSFTYVAITTTISISIACRIREQTHSKHILVCDIGQANRK